MKTKRMRLAFAHLAVERRLSGRSMWRQGEPGEQRNNGHLTLDGIDLPLE
ncbi:hypothetical protein [Streptomyces luteogriseus]|nr:hypothetical protein [Streptomyces luteogriseus]